MDMIKKIEMDDIKHDIMKIQETIEVLRLDYIHPNVLKAMEASIIKLKLRLRFLSEGI